jgi:hypothetical protein
MYVCTCTYVQLVLVQVRMIEIDQVLKFLILTRICVVVVSHTSLNIVKVTGLLGIKLGELLATDIYIYIYRLILSEFSISTMYMWSTSHLTAEAARTQRSVK